MNTRLQIVPIVTSLLLGCAIFLPPDALSQSAQASVGTGAGTAASSATSNASGMATSNAAGTAAGNNGSADAKQIAFLAPHMAAQQMRTSAHNSFIALDFAASAQQYSQICRSADCSANDLTWLGEALYHAKDYTGAAQAFSRAVDMNAGDSVKVRLVETYLAGKQKSLAKQECEKALSSVKNEYARNQLKVLQKISNTEFKPPRNGQHTTSIHTES